MNNTERANKLIQLKDALASAKSEYDKLSGNLDSYTKNLKENFGVSTIKEAKDKLITMETEKASLEKELETILPEIEGSLSKWM